MLIIGYGLVKRTIISDFDEPFLCARCGNEVRHQVIFSRKQFSLYFIPVFSYDKRWDIECPICGQLQPITSQQAYSPHPLLPAPAH